MGKKKSTRGILHKEVPLNYLALGIALSGFFIPIVTESPLGLVQDAQSMLADSGTALTAAVPPNPYNTLADQLNQKEQELNAREEALNARGMPGSGNIYGFVSFILSFILCALIGLNFYLDSRRGKKRGVIGKYSVDLS